MDNLDFENQVQSDQQKTGIKRKVATTSEIWKHYKSYSNT